MVERRSFCQCSARPEYGEGRWGGVKETENYPMDTSTTTTGLQTRGEYARTANNRKQERNGTTAMLLTEEGARVMRRKPSEADARCDTYCTERRERALYAHRLRWVATHVRRDVHAPTVRDDGRV